MLPGGRDVKFTPKFVRPNWLPRGCLVRSLMSEARGSGNVNMGTRAGADTASMAAAEKSLGIVTPKPIGRRTVPIEPSRSGDRESRGFCSLPVAKCHSRSKCTLEGTAMALQELLTEYRRDAVPLMRRRS